MPDLNVLIPLDGSQLAESALDYLPYLKPYGSLRLKLVSVLEATEHPGSATEEASHRARGTRLLHSYLKDISEREGLQGGTVVTLVRTGNAAKALLREANRDDTDVVLLTTHGRSGVDLLWLGSVADKVIRGTTKPVFIIGPEASRSIAGPHSIVVPLDGSELAEEALPVASMLTDALLASLHLVRVVNMTALAGGAPFEIYSPELFESVEQGADEYLTTVAARFPNVTSTTVLVGTPVLSLTEYIGALPGPLVVLTSHGRHGVVRWALGSVAERLIRGPAPVVLLHAARQGGDRSGLIQEAQRYARPLSLAT